jgi:hypothetical protein
MRIRDIIEAATPGPWEVRGCVVPGEAIDYCYKDGNASVRAPIANTGVCDDKRLNPKSDARFIATFDPKHVALMEAVCEAVGRCGSGLVMDAPHEWRTVAEAYDALQAYRKERGL